MPKARKGSQENAGRIMKAEGTPASSTVEGEQNFRNGPGGVEIFPVAPRLGAEGWAQTKGIPHPVLSDQGGPHGNPCRLGQFRAGNLPARAPDSGLGLGPLLRSFGRGRGGSEQLCVVRLQVGEDTRKTTHLRLHSPLPRFPKDFILGESLAEMGYLKVAILHLP